MMASSDFEDELEGQFHSPWSLGHDNDHGRSMKSFKDDGKAVRSHDTHSLGSKVRHQKSFGWEMVDGVREDIANVECPPAERGLLYRRRKWPMKGWSKIHVFMEAGILAYSKSNSQFNKRHFDGEIDLGLAVVSYKLKRLRIDIDADMTLYHLKVKEADMIGHWVSRIKAHRLYRQWKLMGNGSESAAELDSIGTTEVREPSKLYSAFENINALASTIVTGSCGERRANFQRAYDGLSRELNSSDGQRRFSKASKEMVRTLTLTEEAAEDIPSSFLVLLDEDLKVIKGKLDILAENLNLVFNHLKSTSPALSASNPSLAVGKMTITSVDTKPSRPLGHNVQDEISQAKVSQVSNSCREVFSLLQSVFGKLSLERSKMADRSRGRNSIPSNANSVIAELTLQNNELRARLARIRSDATISLGGPSVDLPVLRGSVSASTTDDNSARDLRKTSRALTISEMFYDAPEFLNSDSASTISETDEIDELSDMEEDVVVEADTKRRTHTLYQEKTGRRDKLPAPQPDISQFSLVNLLCKNIGRDLSKVRLPVILNEPLSVLQMLCESFEYSDVLDVASSSKDPLERMQYLAAFAVSGYASTLYRAGTKPFNPLIGETYEYVRPDKGWKFIAEQVSHHPPVSVCHCESDSWIFWQEFRLKNKFWGKSIEAVPTGSLKVTFKRFNEVVTWNKVTTCIFNIFGQNRYVEHYGDMNFCSSLGTSAKITFHKSNSWVHQKYEVSGTVTGTDSRKCQLFGKWTEGLYVGEEARCVWRPGTMPVDLDQYYGFTMFAIDLNNLDEELRATVPGTDCRLRPDQRLLEEGQVLEAEAEKSRVEEVQRARMKEAHEGASWQPLWFRSVDKGQGVCVYDFKGDYWTARVRHFKDVPLPRLW